MEQTFEDALLALMDKYADTPADEKIGALQLRIMALEEEDGDDSE